MNEKIDLLMYLAENGYDFGENTIEEVANAMPLTAIHKFVAEWLGEDPTA
jgi:hypothetical protein